MVVYSDNIFAVNAVAELYMQVERIDDSVSGYTQLGFYQALVNLRHPNLRVHQIREGSDKGKLTLERKIDDKWELDTRINPVDCYNLIADGESIPDAINRIFN